MSLESSAPKTFDTAAALGVFRLRRWWREHESSEKVVTHYECVACGVRVDEKGDCGSWAHDGCLASVLDEIVEAGESA